MDENRSDANTLRRQMFASQRRVNEQIASPDYDAAALEQAFIELRSIGLQYQELSHQQMLAILSELTAEERAIAREFMQRRGPRSGRQSREGREGRPPPPEFAGDQRRPPPPQD
jgi:Spy/CpxP family protein refolding chaperone